MVTSLGMDKVLKAAEPLNLVLTLTFLDPEAQNRRLIEFSRQGQAMEEGEVEEETVGESQRPRTPSVPPPLLPRVLSFHPVDPPSVAMPSPSALPAKHPLDNLRSPAPRSARNEFRSAEYLVVSSGMMM